MARRLRCEYEDAIYHVTVRRQEGADLFLEARDYIRLLTVLANAGLIHEVIYFAYCLMPNHYHLLLKTPQANLSKTMHWINTKYSTYFNWRYDHQGHVLQGRFHAQEVKNDSYLLEVSRYIHLNPVRAGLVKEAREYRYSSLGAYTGHIDYVHIDTSLILGHFDGMTNQYLAFLKDGLISKGESATHGVDMDVAQRILIETCQSWQITMEELRAPATMRHKQARNKAIMRIAEETDLSLKEIGKIAGLSSPSTIHRIIKKQ